MNIRAFTMSAVASATHRGAPPPNSVVATICEAPALTRTDMPRTSAIPKPARHSSMRRVPPAPTYGEERATST